ncbi:MAG: pepsin/retropepsin-like aspartic protease family protein [Gammaproteobacteria bacterium]|nr:pepsin/retropepsin-like aspartic protease family protein [Gammaproteobacteria bacterium]
MAYPNGRWDQPASDPRHAGIVRAGCVARSRSRFLTLATGFALATAFGTEAEPRSAEVEELLSEAVRASSDGDFETAWTSHRRAWQLAFASPEAGEAMESYCERHDCPKIRNTAWLLGKPSTELAFLTDAADYCRHGEGESCDAWFARMRRLRAHLGPNRRAQQQRSHEVPLRFLHIEANHLAAWTIASISGKPVWALLDTGAPHTFVGRDWGNLQGLDYDIVGDAYTQRMWDGAELRSRLAVFRDVEVGSATEERVLAVVADGTSWNFLGLGMDMLLRYRSACFAWSDGTLHLGRTGPCAHGVSPYGARLDPRSNKPVVLVPASDATTTSVLVDTGSRDNHCKRSLAERLQGRTLAFGDHPALQAACDPPDGKWPPKHEDDPHAMTIGMETLSEFEAFGWQLDPFRMYFVPRTGPVVMGSNASTKPERRREFLEERLAAAARAVGDGDFPAAWTSLREASLTALSSREATDARNAFCAREPCPDIWRIAWLAGRSAPDLAFLGGICKDLESEPCRRWLVRQHRGRAYLGPARRPPSNPAREVPLRVDGPSDDPRPRTVVEVAGKTTPALLNTGARNSAFRRKWANMEAVDYDVVGDPYAETRRDGTETQVREVVLRNLTLSGVTEPRVLAVARDNPDAEFELGIDVLLRYPAVCLALGDGRLHLGRRGPCADGRISLAARLDPEDGQPTIVVAGPDGAPITALLDTGARQSRCTASLAERLRGIPLRLGGHATVEAGCDRNGDRLPDNGDPYDMVLGMDWLSRFEAFGWELAPFRLYFVPASAPP